MAAKLDSYQELLIEFRTYLRLERGMSANTIGSYLSDCRKYFEFLAKSGAEGGAEGHAASRAEGGAKNRAENLAENLAESGTANRTEDLAANRAANRAEGLQPEDVPTEIIDEFLATEVAKGLTKRSQARVISSLKSLYKYLDIEGKLMNGNPCDKITGPKINPYLPTVLSVDEVTRIIDSVDLSKPEGHRNKCILEVLYSCGLRVSELVNLKISDLFLREGFIKVFGKGSKQRLVPVGEPAIKAITLYLEVRNCSAVARGCEDILFLNHRGGKLSRISVFNIVKEGASAAGVTKEISPHTFRHSFATHLVENGADLRVVQEMLGHESILTTEIYTHIDTTKWQETILKFHPER